MISGVTLTHFTDLRLVIYKFPFIFLLILFTIEWLTYRGIKSVTTRGKKGQCILRAYLLLTVIALGIVWYTLSNFQTLQVSTPSFLVFGLGVFFVALLTKFSFVLFYLFDSLSSTVLGVFKKRQETNNPDLGRRKFITKLGLGFSSLFFGGLVYGIFKGRYDFRVMAEEIISPKIPPAFDGTKIIHISDAHLGSFLENFDPIAKAVEMINDLEADYVFFTGDMVNNHASEALPWVGVFGKIKAKKGKFSIFGNHDYADYGVSSTDEKEKSIALLKEIHRDMGFRLLEDEHLLLQRGTEEINLIGVHNWGRGFHQIGDLEKAKAGLNEGNFSILLSHDPTHYDRQVKGKTSIDLTLSGHTHGAQLGIEVPNWNIKWSPIKYIYPQWAGLYRDGEQQLYVNRGFGVLAYPGRLGVPPEITLLTLRSEKT